MISRKRFHILAVTIFLVALVVSPAAADELILRDGRKINGTIVGFENGMFRVETEYGFALVKKEKVSTVNLSEGGSKGGVAEGGEKKNQKTVSKLGARGAENGSVQAGAHVEADSAKALTSQAEAQSSPPTPAPVTTPRPAPVSHLAKEPLPSPLRDHVEGNSYVNDSFQFAMFKPPGWKIYEGVPKETGYGIMAMGTEDEQTLLIVDREVWSGPPDVKNDRAVEKLRQTNQDFQKISESPAQLDGLLATRRLFKVSFQFVVQGDDRDCSL